MLRWRCKLRDRLNAAPGMRAMLTRDADFFVPLHDRVRKARRVQADLFVSIHADAFITPQGARRLGVRAVGQAAPPAPPRAGWPTRRTRPTWSAASTSRRTKDAHVLRALLDMSTTRADQGQPASSAARCCGSIGRVGHLHKARVEQAGFAVLKAPDIPSILVETAFISNPEEEAQAARRRATRTSWSRRWPPASSATSRRTRRWRATGRCERGGAGFVGLLRFAAGLQNVLRPG